MSWKNKKIILKTMVWCGIYSAVGGLWQALEYILYGQVITSYEDTIVGIIVTFAIYKLFMNGISFE